MVPPRRKLCGPTGRICGRLYGRTCEPAGCAELRDSRIFAQAVMGSFFIRVRAGEYDIAGSVELKRLLGRMAENKVADLARKPEFRSPVLAVSGPGVKGVEPIASGAGPASELVWNDMIDAINARLTASERSVSVLRTMGLSWNEVADRLGEKPDAVRNRLDRAIKRVVRELGLEELDDD